MLNRQPSRADALDCPSLRIARHPLLTTMMTALRDVRTPADRFGETIAEISRLLLWQALATLQTQPVTVPGHSGQLVPGNEIGERVAALIILRAGLSMIDPVRTLLPNAPIYQIGIRRDERTLAPLVYYNNLPGSLSGADRVLVLDPMLATGGSALAALDYLRRCFDGPTALLGVIGAPIGVIRVSGAFPDTEIHLAALDDRLDERGYIIPGLGDAGDRLFGTG